MKKIFINCTFFVLTMFLCCSLINVHASGPIALPLYDVVNVSTDNGTPIESYRYHSDLTTNQKNDLNSQYDNYQMITESTLFFNCHSYAFYFKGNLQTIPSQSNAAWISDAMAYINDGSYIEINYENIREGDLVAYWKNGSISHSGIIKTNLGGIKLFNGNLINVTSKMDMGPLIQHTLYDAGQYYPESQTTIKFYTQNFHILRSIRSLDAYSHEGICNHCSQTDSDEVVKITEGHVFIQGISNYMCKYCRYITPFIPIIQGDMTYYLFANDQSQTLRTYTELQLYLVKNNYLSYLENLKQFKNNEVK